MNYKSRHIATSSSCIKAACICLVHFLFSKLIGNERLIQRVTQSFGFPRWLICAFNSFTAAYFSAVNRLPSSYQRSTWVPMRILNSGRLKTSQPFPNLVMPVSMETTSDWQAWRQGPPVALMLKVCSYQSVSVGKHVVRLWPLSPTLTSLMWIIKVTAAHFGKSLHFLWVWIQNELDGAAVIQQPQQTLSR